MFWKSLRLVPTLLRQRLLSPNQVCPSRPSGFGSTVPLELTGMNVAPALSVQSSLAASSIGVLQQSPFSDVLGGISILFAVPKRKHTKSRKRMKTTVPKRIPLKKNIVFDPRTGEVTLQHKLPFNWKDYLPKDYLPKVE